MHKSEEMQPCTIEEQLFFKCPCGEDAFRFDHLRENWKSTGKKPYSGWGPWYCEHCGTGWGGEVQFDPAEVKVRKIAEKRRQWVVLEVVPTEEPIRFQVLSEEYDHGEGYTDRNLEYFYNEHTCPTNWIRDVKKIIVGSDTDPHGFARVVQSFSYDASDPRDEKGDSKWLLSE